RQRKQQQPGIRSPCGTTMNRNILRLVPTVRGGAMALLLAIAPGVHPAPAAPDAQPMRDPHSYANTHEFRTTHASLELSADFRRQELGGHVDLSFERLGDAREIV